MVGGDCQGDTFKSCCYNTTINGQAQNVNVGVCNDDLPLGMFGTMDFLNWNIREITRLAFLGLVMVFAGLF